jgi:monoamine oxidase
VTEAVDILIVGGGVSGLAAAEILTNAGFKLAVLEGRNRLGGRVHTLHLTSVPVPVELGAEFIHGKPPEIWNITQKKSLSLGELTGDNACFQGDHLIECNDFWSDWEKVSEAMSLRGNRDESFLSFIDRLGRKRSGFDSARKRAIEYVEGFNAASADDISLASLIQDRDASEKIEGTRPFRLVSGYDQIVDSFPHRSIRLQTVVKNIEWHDGKVVTTAIDERSGRRCEFKARAVVITIPLAVLQSVGQRASVQFHPEIPQKLAAARSLRMGSVIKIILVFKHAFWAGHDFEKLSFLHAHDQPIPVFWTTAPLMSPVLTGWAGGPSADRLKAIRNRT